MEKFRIMVILLLVIVLTGNSIGQLMDSRDSPGNLISGKISDLNPKTLLQKSTNKFVDERGINENIDAPIFNNKYQDDVQSVNSIIKALYDVISGDKGVKRDWERFKNLFHPSARLVPSDKNQEGVTNLRVMTPQEYVDNSGKWLEENGFHETEIYRVLEEYGSLVHCWSTYESRHAKVDADPFTRGINSIQMMNDGSRWWIIQIYWLGEKPDNQIPVKYLPKK